MATDQLNHSIIGTQNNFNLIFRKTPVMDIRSVLTFDQPVSLHSSDINILLQRVLRTYSSALYSDLIDDWNVDVTEAIEAIKVIGLRYGYHAALENDPNITPDINRRLDQLSVKITAYRPTGGEVAD